jgi:TonB family protein
MTSARWYRNCFLLVSLIVLLILLPVLSQTDIRPHRKVIFQAEPEYPAFLREGHFEGLVRLELTVRPNGTVSDVRVKGGNPILAQYASRAVFRWKFAPAPAESTEEVIFHFLPRSQ